MTIKDLKKLNETYLKILEQQQFHEADLDYSILKKHEAVLRKLAETGKSVITVFDLFKKQHVFHSSNYDVLLGYSKHDFAEGGEYFLDSKIHPEDLMALLQNGISLLKLLNNFTTEQKQSYKLINEYRILNAANQYTRVIEQQQALELDSKGNVWLALSILDMSPNQNQVEGIKAEIINFRTGMFVPLFQSKEKADNKLSDREIEILRLIKEGFLSKEISDKLFISVHTVNTHRQRILEKLKAGNSLEAIMLASRLGLLEY